jgi:hypothetical protein
MIPYEDLVYALSEWRARKGLPTTSVAAPPAAAPVAPPARAVPPPPAAAAAWQPDAPTTAQPHLEIHDDSIAIEGEEFSDAGDTGEAGEAGDAMEFDSVRPGTQPGFAPVAGGPTGQRR